MELITGFAGAIVWSGLVICALLWFVTFYFLGNVIFPIGLYWRKQRRFKLMQSFYQKIGFLFGIHRGNAVAEYDQLFRAAGWRKWEGKIYVLSKRLCIFTLSVMGIAVWSYSAFMQTIAMLLIIVIFISIVDKKMLDALRKRRERLMIEEMYYISNQLLYLSDSQMNLHGKLTRCLPHAKVLRHEFILLLHEWYEDVNKAFEHFKERLGTSEGYSFAETLYAIHQFDSDYYYELLRQRLDDYKMTLEMHRDSQRETLSYALFVLAGIPILNTFRIFIYPWVEEGQRLMDILN